jgi:hypothetical protein
VLMLAIGLADEKNTTRKEGNMGLSPKGIGSQLICVRMGDCMLNAVFA